MTAFTTLCAAASGVLEFRLVIEGIGTVFVTSEAMAGTDSEGRAVVPGLRRRGIGFSERVWIAEAEHEVQIDGITIDEVGGQWLGVASRVFNRKGRRVDGLTSTLDTSDPGTANVNDSALFTTGTRYYLGTETVKVTAKPTGTTLTIDRGEWGSTAQEHLVAVGERAQVSSLTDGPTGLSHRRVWLYAHTASELTTASAGTIIWRGVLSREPALDPQNALSWSLAVEPRTKLLEGSLAGGFDQPFKLRGAYYPAASPLRLQVRRYSTAAHFVGSTTDVTVVAFGHFETQTSFCEAVSDALNGDATISSWGVTFSALVNERGGWDLYVTTDSTPLFVSVHAGSRVDGAFDGEILSGSGVDERIVYVVAASTTYRCQREDSARGGIEVSNQGLLPRSNNLPDGDVGAYITDADIAAYPIERIYLDRLGALTDDDGLLVTPSVDEAGRAYPADVDPPVQRLNIDVDAATGSITASVGHGPRILAAGAQQPTITGSADFGAGTVADFRDTLISRAPEVANRGQSPWVTADDLADWHDATNEQAAGRAWLEQRNRVYGKPVRSDEVLQHEWRLYGLIPYLDDDAKIAVRPFTAGGSAIDMEVGPDEILVDESLGSISGEADGTWNVVELATEYDPTEDKHLADPAIVFRGLEAIARVHAERKLSIKPRSRAVGPEPTWEDLSDRARSIIALFGDRRTQLVHVNVSLVAFSVKVGDVVSLTVSALPADGERTEWSPGLGMIAEPGIVLGRKWDMAAGKGELDVLVHELDLAPYAPSLRVTAASGATTTWSLTVTQNRYAPTGTDDTSFFAVGDRIRLREWDATSPTVRPGEVTSVTATTVGVELDASWAGLGGAAYVVGFDVSSHADTTAAQLEYMYQGGATGRVTLASGSNPPDTFAP